MQNLYHDGGFSSMGMSLKAMAMYNKSLEMDLGLDQPLDLD
jgi:enoyl-[acyl-carrier protein] reductase I